MPTSQPTLSPLKVTLVLGTFVALGPLTIDLYLPALPTIADDLMRTGEPQVQHRATDHVHAHRDAFHRQQRRVGFRGGGVAAFEYAGGRERGPVRRPQPGDPAAFLVHQDGRFFSKFLAHSGG